MPRDENKTISTLAKVSVVLGVLGFFCPLISLMALATGQVARREIDRADGEIQGEGQARLGTMLGGIATILWGAVIVMSILLPMRGRTHVPARKMQNAMQIRGVVQGCILFAQGNNEYYPGLSSTGDPTVAAVNEPNQFTVLANDQSVANRFAILLNGNYFTPEYAISPLETLPKTKAVPGQRVTTDNFSYAMLQISGSPHTRDAGRDKEWFATTNPLAIVVGDRGKDVNLPTTSIHVTSTTDPATRPQDWRGSVVYNDNHVDFATSALIPATKYGSAANTDDNLFVDEGTPPNITKGANALFIYD